MKIPTALQTLPICPYLDKIVDTLLSSRSRFLVLTAETAAGKSTAVPVAFLGRVPGKIVMLEPRRLATVAIADRIASVLGERAGETAGYRVHLDSKVGPATKIEIITEAILTRRMQGDPSLEGISVVILDEFHERSVHTDLALALLKDIMSLREDLYVIVMSATIDTEKIAAFLDAPVLSVPGRRFPVAISHAADLASRSDISIAEKTARTVLRCLESDGGAILAFLPGLYEISRTKELLEGSGAEVLVLHSSVPLAEQRKVLSAPDSADNAGSARRVILSSSIAETSLTVPGISIVIDSGLSRTVRFNVATGMDRLVTETESEFQATQRAGRAGRLGPGSCIRLWAERDVRVSETPPEITRTDIMPLVLECALWGVQSLSGLDWLDPPNDGSWQTARDLLASMGALDNDGLITAKGRSLASLGVHPRIGSVALAGEMELAAKYGVYADNPRERERFRADLERRVSAAYREERTARPATSCRASGPMALLEGFPDRIARHRDSGVYQFPSGRLAGLPPEVRKNTARPSEWIVAPEVDAGDRTGRIHAYENLPEAEAIAWLERHSSQVAEFSFSGGSSLRDGKPVKTLKTMYGKILLSERRMEMDSCDLTAVVCASIRKEGLSSLPWSAASESFLIRARFALRDSDTAGHAAPSGFSPDPRTSNSALVDSLEDWLVPFLPANGVISESILLDALRYRLDGSFVDREAPVRITLPNGLSRPLSYEEIVPGEGPSPVLETRIQDLYGCADIPRVAGIRVLIKLLSPAGRPMQITRDLAGFWKGSWADVRKDMRGRYPKHDWPENPALASPPQPKRSPHSGGAK